MTDLVYGRGWTVPCGHLVLVAGGDGLREILFRPDAAAVEAELAARFPTAVRTDTSLLEQARQQLDEWFAGQRTGFELPLAWHHVTGFTRRCLEELVRVPYGEVVHYGELARRLGSPGAARAVGRAMAANPWPVVIPCHRVLAAGGGWGGYSGGCGIDSKRWLLDFEASVRLA